MTDYSIKCTCTAANTCINCLSGWVKWTDDTGKIGCYDPDATADARCIALTTSGALEAVAVTASTATEGLVCKLCDSETGCVTCSSWQNTVGTDTTTDFTCDSCTDGYFLTATGDPESCTGKKRLRSFNPF